ncbi:tartrate-resistant acid phosphatase type 5 family protein [Cesiribacter sp. SM1]|uniref:purple acid phosphatase family protein n=1 Tax=Cesiribacter sp. SM1 TaxID=2861196 RepID=UPI001CD6591A|nr:tartrate-resistant acid phosphatase type 5 family protein [Cesiribacter sp. SM1]
MKKTLFYLPVLFIAVALLSFTFSTHHKNQAADKPAANTPALNFIVMGDWGRNGEDHQKEVARQMGKTAKEMGVSFVVSTGDNFYPSGVVSEFDPLWRYSFEDIYTDFSLQFDWYPILGNHDYKSDPDAQVAYSKISRRWKMPARYYSKTFNIPGSNGQKVLIAFIDTNPLIKEFYSNTEYGPNVASQDTLQQKRWLEEVLSTPDPDIQWKLVVGHHPMFSGGMRKEGYDTKAIRSTLKPLLDKHEADAYISGHEHDLQHILPEGKTHHFISGSASEIRKTGKLPESKFAASEYGFMVFSVTKDAILVQVINDEGKVLYKTKLEKR